MNYVAKLLHRQFESSATGATEDQAIERALTDSIALREADPRYVALVMFREYANQREVAYATTLLKYRLDTE